MNSVPPFGKLIFRTKSRIPIRIAAKNTPLIRPSPPTATTIRKYAR
jgi:hypothetical protein